MVIEGALASGPDQVGARLATVIAAVLQDPRARGTMAGLIRAAASEEEAAVRVRDLLVTRVLTPLAHALGGPDPELRASLAASQLAGLLLARHVVGLPRLAAEPPERLAAAVGPVLQHYLTGDLGTDRLQRP